MISAIGNILQISAAALAIFAILAPNVKVKKFTAYFSSISLILCFALLVTGFVTSDFSILNVFLNSSTVKPLVFKISGTWASHEGSMLLWLSLLCLVEIISLQIIHEKVVIKKQLTLISIIKLLFILFIYFTSNPFVKITTVTQQGLGLNPTLQDIALAIHPPMLYFGYVCLVIPFVNTVVTCSIDNDFSKLSLLQSSRFFTGLSLIFTTSGIGLGSWWAYRELGWGGYWFFDPVENISLLPWLAAVALYHSLNVAIKHNKLVIWTNFFSIGAFWLVIFGTVLVRSGFLVSVHSFAASGERAIYLFIILTIITIISIVVLVTQYQKREFNTNSSCSLVGIRTGNILWLINIIILLLSIIYPLLYALIGYEYPSLNADFFLISFLPVIIITLFAASIFMVRKNNTSVIILVLAGLITAIICFSIVCNFIAIGAIFVSSYLILQSSYLLIDKNHTDFRKSNNFMAMIISHMGCGLLAFCITLNCLLQDEVEFSGRIGESKNSKQFDVLLKNVKFAEAENYYRQIAEFWILDKNNNTMTVIKPENRYYKVEKILSQESDIYSYLTYDIYGVLNKVEDDVITAKIYYRPMMSFIWLSIMVIISGFMISKLSKIHRVFNNK
ncbi:MAG: heme lyase CcmF/NrfE family subunit [Rickettsiaceae bacterium]|nr:MAG: heme lyase CcmF/NrfE family subunit [Rickettsiaceae bacterium]